MANVPVPIPLRDELRRQDLVVWSATRLKKGEPISVEIAGPSLPIMAHGWGLTIEEAVVVALRSPTFLRDQPGLAGAMCRLDRALNDLRWCVWQETRPPYTGLDDDIPF